MHGYVRMDGTKYISNVRFFCAHAHGPRTRTRTQITCKWMARLIVNNQTDYFLLVHDC